MTVSAAARKIQSFSGGWPFLIKKTKFFDELNGLRPLHASPEELIGFFDSLGFDELFLYCAASLPAPIFGWGQTRLFAELAGKEHLAAIAAQLGDFAHGAVAVF